MPRTRRWFSLLVPLAAGGLAASIWVATAGGNRLADQLLSARPGAVLAMLGVTTGWFLLLFVRWQFLLRRAGVRIPTRPALATYLAALPGTATPAYLGEALRSVFLYRRLGTPLRATLPILVLGRVYDVAAIALLALLSGHAGARLVGAGFLAAAAAGMGLSYGLCRRTGMPPVAAARLFAPAVIAPALGASVVAWLVAAGLYRLAGQSIGLALPISESIAIFAKSTLLGALTLLPAGAGVTGSAAIVDLAAGGLPVSTAVYVVTLVRLTSVGLCLAVGTAFLWRELRGVPRGPALVAHFDTIATEYAAQWSPHVWDLLLDRKLSLMAAALPSPPEAAGRGLDLGCGLAIQATEMRRRGYRVIGLEPATGLLARRADPATPVVAGDGMRLPFADGALDFVYAVGVLHHLPGREAQAGALAEIHRVLRPGGTLLVHESNPRNPFFRFYMGYLFPILKSIDEGTEWWIDPREWATAPGLRLERTSYFTFLPDFVPRAFLRPALAVERWLERGPTAPFSAHYLAVLRREALAGSQPAAPG